MQSITRCCNRHRNFDNQLFNNGFADERCVGTYFRLFIRHVVFKGFLGLGEASSSIALYNGLHQKFTMATTSISFTMCERTVKVQINIIDEENVLELLLIECVNHVCVPSDRIYALHVC